MRDDLWGARAVLLFGVVVGGTLGLNGTVLLAAEQPPPAAAPAAGETAAPAETPAGPGGARGQKGGHPLRKACHDDVKKFCGDVKPGEGRIVQCLKQHAQEVSPACAEQMQSHGKRK